MSICRAFDEPQRGAPFAICSHDDVVRVLAPLDITPIAGAVPPSYTFHRHDYFWLALTLSTGDDSAAGQSLDGVFVGTHTLTWDAMHAAIRTALAAGFSLPTPSDFSSAVRAALLWSLGHK